MQSKKPVQSHLAEKSNWTFPDPWVKSLRRKELQSNKNSLQLSGQFLQKKSLAHWQIVTIAYKKLRNLK